MKRPTPPSWLTEAFREQALAFFTHAGPAVSGQPLRLYDGGPACWLKQFDHLDRPCSGELEGVHLLGRQRIRNTLRPLLTQARLGEPVEGVPLLLQPIAFLSEEIDDLVELAEWDPRLGVPGCTGHHRRLDSHATPELKVPATATPGRFRDFVSQWGFESDAVRRFGFDLVDLLPPRPTQKREITA